MSENTQGLSAEERAELEQLRAEKAAREQAARDRAERAELERLKAERDRKRAEAEKDAHARELRERNAKLMEPDDDLGGEEPRLARVSRGGELRKCYPMLQCSSHKTRVVFAPEGNVPWH